MKPRHFLSIDLGAESGRTVLGKLNTGKLMITETHRYRDARTDGMMHEAFRYMPREELFANTGIQFLQLNTLEFRAEGGRHLVVSTLPKADLLRAGGGKSAAVRVENFAANPLLGKSRWGWGVTVIERAMASADVSEFFEGWMGGADYKVLASLTALWSLGGLVALLAAGIWGGAVVLLTRNRLSIFPGVTAMAFGVALTFLAEVAIYLAKIAG